jgi:shikimate dehydrogenase
MAAPMTEGARGSARRCAVLGSPIAHSLSPVLHRAAYAELGLDWSYEAVEVASDGLETFLGGLDGSWRGLSLTMPLKRAVMPLLDDVDDWARLSGAANTVLLEDGRRQGANTDVTGAIAAIHERTDGSFTSAVVLGGGATATSVLLALAELGLATATLAVREPARAAETVHAVARHPRAPEVTVVAIDDALPPGDIVVSTIPAAAQSPDVVDRCRTFPVVFDVVYDPWPTPLAASAADRVLVSGLDLLVAQALDQVLLMTGSHAEPRRLLDVMRDAGARVLTERSAS